MTSGPAGKIAILGKAIAPEAMDMARDAGFQVVTSDTYLQGDELVEFLRRHQPEGIVLRLGRVSEQAMAAAPALKIIAKHGVGYDTIDIEAAARRGIIVSIAVGANAVSVAEHALALMLAVARGIAHLDARMRQGHWDKADYLGTELNGKVLGIVGMGAIGRHLADICRALRMEIQVYDPALSGDGAVPFRQAGSLDELLASSDIISLHCPLVPATRNMISHAQFAMMKPRAILINTARGGLVDLEAVQFALQEYRIGGVGLDTFPDEPPTLNEAFRSLSNLVISPHVGASTGEAGQRVGVMAMSQVLDCLAGRRVDPACIVNGVTLDVPRVALG